jgi:hypothetical protein
MSLKLDYETLIVPEAGELSGLTRYGLAGSLVRFGLGLLMTGLIIVWVLGGMNWFR